MFKLERALGSKEFTDINTETDTVIIHFLSRCPSIKTASFVLLFTFKQALLNIFGNNLAFIIVVLTYFQRLTILISDIFCISTLQIVFFHFSCFCTLYHFPSSISLPFFFSIIFFPYLKLFPWTTAPYYWIFWVLTHPLNTLPFFPLVFTSSPVCYCISSMYL